MIPTQHAPSTQKAKDYVAWFHRKFRNPYATPQWPMIRADHEAIINVIDTYDIRTFLEIGTWKGYTALLIYLFDRIERFKCIDIHKDMDVKFEHHYHEIMEKDKVGEFFKNTFVELMFADTMTYSRGCETHDVVFIDGNHDYEHIKNDTVLALSMNPKIIMWHDYLTLGNEDVTRFIDEIQSYGSQLVCFENSICAAARPENIKLS